MRRDFFFNKCALVINLIFSLLMLASCFLPYVSLTAFPIISLLSLMVPLLLFANLIFLVYWAFRLNRAILISLTSLVTGYFFFGTILKLGSRSETVSEGDLTVMSFNTRAFNKYGWIDNPVLGAQIIDFVSSKDPDIVCFQEFELRQAAQLPQYPYQYVYSILPDERKALQAIFSKYPIISNGSLNFPNSYNNAIYADIRYGGDTLRVYDVHLESLHVTPDMKTFTGKSGSRLLRRLGRSFFKQEQQAELLKAHRMKTGYKSLVCGDFNNTRFSNVYHIVKGDHLQDTFEARGKGLGSTYNFKYFPARIDFILIDDSFEVRTHQVFRVPLSDHFPIMSSIRTAGE